MVRLLLRRFKGLIRCVRERRFYGDDTEYGDKSVA